MKARGLVGLWCAWVILSPAPGHASSLDQELETSASQLQNGQIEAAIAGLERAADEGRQHPDLSFNRGLAYLRRVGTASERPGDLGQAAAAFAETLALRPSDAEAQRGLEESQLSVARRNSKGNQKGEAQVSAPLGLLERALLSMSPDALFWLSALGSVVLSGGVVLRFFRAEIVRLWGIIAVSLGGLLLVPCSGLFLARHALFARANAAVIVVPVVDVLDESGRRIKGRAGLVESTLVYVTGPERGLLHLVGLGSREYLPLGQLRIVSRHPL